uniref:Cyclin I family member 2 n=1 Tax=Microcebus murinus TaxID=30608 RepID=A0A8C5Y9Y3_MICMU
MASGPPFPSRPRASEGRAARRALGASGRSGPFPAAAPGRPSARADAEQVPGAPPARGTPDAPAPGGAASARLTPGPRPRRAPGDLAGPLDERRLLGRLEVAREREARRWPGDRAQRAEICGAFEGAVLRLLRLENVFEFSQATFNLALTILGRVVLSAKVTERLLHCVTVTSLRLAVKLTKSRRYLIPHVKDFLKHYGSGYSPNELLRMELAILDRLHWDLCIGTPLDFLMIEKYGVFCSNIKNHGLQFHSLVVLSWPHVLGLLPQRNPSLHVASLTRQLQHCMAGHQLLQFKGSTLALVIITLELERLMPDCCAPISDLLKKAQVSLEQYNRCKELVKQRLRSF